MTQGWVDGSYLHPWKSGQVGQVPLFFGPKFDPQKSVPPRALPSTGGVGWYHPVFKEILLASTNGVSPCVQDSDGVRISAGAPSEEVYEFHFRSRCACVGGCGGGGCGPACLPQGPLRPTHNHPPPPVKPVVL